MPVTVQHNLTATTPDDPAYEIRPSHWNSAHAVSMSATNASEIYGAFSNDPGYNVSFTTIAGNKVVASANVTAAPSPVNVTGANGSSVNAQTIAFSNSNGMTLGVSTAANGATVTGSYTVPTQTAYVFSNSNGVSFGTNGSTVTATVQTNYLTSQSNQAFSAAGGSSAFQTLSFTNSNGVSFSNTNGSVWASVETSYAASNHSHGNPTLNLTNLSGTTASNSAGFTLSLSAAAPGGAASQTLYATGNTTVNSSGTMALSSLLMRGYGVISLGTSNGSILFSSPDTVDITQLSVGMSTNGNTSGDTGLVTGRLVLAGGANITLSGSTNAGSMTISISGGAGGGGGVGISAGTQSVSTGTVVYSNSNNITFGMSGSSRVTASAALNMYALGNTTQNSSTSLGIGVVSLNGLGAMTVGYSNGSVQLSAPATSSLSATGNASLSSNGSTISIGANAAAVSLSGNSTSAGAGYSNVSSGTFFLAGGNNITLSQNGASVTISGANAGGAQTGISGIIVSDTTYTSGTVSFSNANGISFGSSAGQAITASYTRAVVSNAIQSVGSATGSGTNTSRFAADDHVHAGVFSMGVSTGGNTAGDTRVDVGRFVLAGGANVTLSMATAANALNTISIAAAAGGGGAAISAAGNSVSNGTVVFSNSNNVSFGMNGSTVTATITVPAQTNQTLGIYGSSQTFGQSSSSTYDARSLSIFGSGGISVGWSNGSFGISGQTTAAQTNQSLGIYNSSQTTGASSSSTYDARSLSIAYSGNISGGWTNGSMLLTVAPQSVQTQSNVQGIIVSNTTYRTGDVSFSNANGISFGSSAGQAITASYTVPSVTQYFSATNTTFNGANISGSITLNTNGLQLSMSVAAPGAAAENNWVNLLGANTSGNTTASGSTIGYSGINLTLSGTNGSVVNISAPATSSLVGFRGDTVSSNGSTISIGPGFASYFDNMNGEWPNSTAMQFLQSTSHAQPFSIDAPISFAVLRIPMSASMAASSTGVTTGNSQFSYGHSRTHNFVLYSRGTGASSLSLQSVASTQFTDQQSHNVSANANSTQFSYSNRFTYYMSTGTTGFTYDYSSSAASLNFHTSGMTAVTGLKMMEFPWATTLAPGNYWLMYGVSSNTASQYTAIGTRWFNQFSNYGMSQPNLQFGTIGAATNSSIGPYYGLGSFTTAGGGTTASLPISAVTTSGSHNKMFFAVVNIA